MEPPNCQTSGGLSWPESALHAILRSVSPFRKKQPNDVPYWAQNMNLEDFDRFLKEVERAIRKQKVEPVISREEGWWSPKGNPQQRMGLHNVVQMCAPTVPLEWPAIIDEFMRATLAVDPATLSDDFKDVEHRIKIRLLPVDTNVDFEMISYPVCDQFLTVIGIDNPGSVHLPKAETLDNWPVSKSQIYDLALQNLWEQDPPEVREMQGEDGAKLIDFRGPSFFIASHVLMLERHLSSPAPNGALVIAPSRDNMLFHVIEDQRVIPQIPRLISIANNFHTQFPGPVSQSLLWWQDGTLTNLPWDVKNGELDFSPPEEFLEMLNGLT